MPTREQIADAVEIIKMCEPIHEIQGGVWFGRNMGIADATFVDYGACRAFAVAAQALPAIDGLVKVLTRMTQTFKPFTLKPVGGEGSQARLEQQDQIEAHREALAALAALEGK